MTHIPAKLATLAGTTQSGQSDIPLGENSIIVRIRAICPGSNEDCCSLITSCRKMKWTKWDFCWPSNKTRETFVSTSFQKPVSTTASQFRLCYSSRTPAGGGETDTDAWCSNAAKADMPNFCCKNDDQFILTILI